METLYVLVVYFTLTDGEHSKVLFEHLTHRVCLREVVKMQELLMMPDERIVCEPEA